MVDPQMQSPTEADVAPALQGSCSLVGNKKTNQEFLRETGNHIESVKKREHELKRGWEQKACCWVRRWEV